MHKYHFTTDANNGWGKVEKEGFANKSDCHMHTIYIDPSCIHLKLFGWFSLSSLTVQD